MTRVRTENRDGSFDVSDYPIEKVTKLDASSAADDVRVVLARLKAYTKNFNLLGCY